MAVSVEDVILRIEASGILDDTDLAVVGSDAAPVDGDAQKFVRLLVKNERLTAYQAQALWKDKGHKLSFGNYVTCNECGQDHIINRDDASVVESEQSNVPPGYSVLVRLITFAIPVTAVGHQIFMFKRHGGSSHGELFTTSFYVSMIGGAIFGIPSTVVCFKGPMTGPTASLNRKKGISRIVYGVGALVVGAIANVVVNWLGGGFFVFLWYGILGVGAVSISLGLPGILTRKAHVVRRTESLLHW